MSIPHNILGKFRSYAYHHMLLVCNGTEAAELLANTTEITRFQHLRDPEKRYSARPIGPGGENSKNKYITLIDGATDARFYITNVTWENMIAQSSHVDTGDIPLSTSMALDGEMEVIEPLGASFLNRLTKVCDDLQTDPVGLVFVLKTIFVGHTDNGETEMISSVKPLLFVIYDISALFDSSGASYKIAFIGITNGVGKLPQTQKLFEGLSFAYEGTLKNTFDKLSQVIVQAQDNHKKNLIKEIAKIRDISDDDANIVIDQEYRQVKYEIDASDYDDDKNKNKYLAGDVENERTKHTKDTGAWNFGPDVGIEEIIKRIMASSSGVLKDAKDKENPTIYKVISTLKSNADKFVVVYKISKYKRAENPYTSQIKDGNIETLPGQTYVFDYIFTGKNVDIKEFDIKMEMGMAFFQIAATSGSIPDKNNTKESIKTQSVKITGTDTTASKGKSTGENKRILTPLFLGTTLKNKLSRNTKTPIDSASFQALINRQASLEAIGAKLTIYGNPQFLDEMSMLPSDVIKGETETPKEGATVNPRWLSIPTLIKVNIKMPRDTNDVNTEYDDFWYTGWYNLLAVKQIFQDGTFLQEMEIFSIPVMDEFNKQTDEKEEKEAINPTPTNSRPLIIPVVTNLIPGGGIIRTALDIVNVFNVTDAAEKQTPAARSERRRTRSNTIEKNKESP